MTGTSSSLLTNAEKCPLALARVTFSGAARSTPARLSVTQVEVDRTRARAEIGSSAAEYDALLAVSSKISRRSTWLPTSIDWRVEPSLIAWSASA